MEDLPLHGVRSLHDRVKGLGQLNHLCVLCLTLSRRHALSSLVSGDHFGQELLLLLERHALHRLLKLNLLIVGHQSGDLIKLLL